MPFVPNDRWPGVRAMVPRLMSLARRVLWTMSGALTMRPVPVRAKPRPRPDHGPSRLK